MKRRDFLRFGLKGSAAYTLLPATLLGTQVVQAARGGRGGGGQTDVVADSVSDATETEIEDLMYMREEEKLARDVYRTMYESWGTPVFSNIADSEQVHTLAVKDKIDKYDLDDPVLDDTTGVFVNTKLQTLYDTLVDQGNISEMDALWVGGAIEEIDMIDLQEAIDNADHPDIANVYQNLMDGSKNHLRAFVAVIESKGVTYSAQYLSQAEVDAILNS